MDCETKEVQAPDVLMLELEGCVVHPKQEKDFGSCDGCLTCTSMEPGPQSAQPAALSPPVPWSPDATSADPKLQEESTGRPQQSLAEEQRCQTSDALLSDLHSPPVAHDNKPNGCVAWGSKGKGDNPGTQELPPAKSVHAGEKGDVISNSNSPASQRRAGDGIANSDSPASLGNTENPGQTKGNAAGVTSVHSSEDRVRPTGNRPDFSTVSNSGNQSSQHKADDKENPSSGGSSAADISSASGVAEDKNAHLMEEGVADPASISKPGDATSPLTSEEASCMPVEEASCVPVEEVLCVPQVEAEVEVGGTVEADEPTAGILDVRISEMSGSVEVDMEVSSADVVEEMEVPSSDVVEEMAVPSADCLQVEEVEVSSVKMGEDMEVPSTDVEVPSVDVVEDVELSSTDVLEYVEVPSVHVVEVPSVNVVEEIPREDNETSAKESEQGGSGSLEVSKTVAVETPVMEEENVPAVDTVDMEEVEEEEAEGKTAVEEMKAKEERAVETGVVEGPVKELVVKADTETGVVQPETNARAEEGENESAPDTQSLVGEDTETSAVQAETETGVVEDTKTCPVQPELETGFVEDTETRTEEGENSSAPDTGVEEDTETGVVGKETGTRQGLERMTPNVTSNKETSKEGGREESLAAGLLIADATEKKQSPAAGDRAEAKEKASTERSQHHKGQATVFGAEPLSTPTLSEQQQADHTSADLPLSSEPSLQARETETGSQRYGNEPQKASEHRQRSAETGSEIDGNKTREAIEGCQSDGGDLPVEGKIKGVDKAGKSGTFGTQESVEDVQTSGEGGGNLKQAVGMDTAQEKGGSDPEEAIEESLTSQHTAGKMTDTALAQKRGGSEPQEWNEESHTNCMDEDAPNQVTGDADTAASSFSVSKQLCSAAEAEGTEKESLTGSAAANERDASATEIPEKKDAQIMSTTVTKRGKAVEIREKKDTQTSSTTVTGMEEAADTVDKEVEMLTRSATATGSERDNAAETVENKPASGTQAVSAKGGEKEVAKVQESEMQTISTTVEQRDGASDAVEMEEDMLTLFKTVPVGDAMEKQKQSCAALKGQDDEITIKTTGETNVFESLSQGKFDISDKEKDMALSQTAVKGNLSKSAPRLFNLASTIGDTIRANLKQSNDGITVDQTGPAAQSATVSEGHKKHEATSPQLGPTMQVSGSPQTGAGGKAVTLVRSASREFGNIFDKFSQLGSFGNNLDKDSTNDEGGGPDKDTADAKKEHVVLSTSKEAEDVKGQTEKNSTEAKKDASKSVVLSTSKQARDVKGGGCLTLMEKDSADAKKDSEPVVLSPSKQAGDVKDSGLTEKDTADTKTDVWDSERVVLSPSKQAEDAKLGGSGLKERWGGSVRKDASEPQLLTASHAHTSQGCRGQTLSGQDTAGSRGTDKKDYGSDRDCPMSQHCATRDNRATDKKDTDRDSPVSKRHTTKDSQESDKKDNDSDRESVSRRHATKDSRATDKKDSDRDLSVSKHHTTKDSRDSHKKESNRDLSVSKHHTTKDSRDSDKKGKDSDKKGKDSDKKDKDSDRKSVSRHHSIKDSRATDKQESDRDSPVSKHHTTKDSRDSDKKNKNSDRESVSKRHTTKESRDSDKQDSGRDSSVSKHHTTKDSRNSDKKKKDSDRESVSKHHTTKDSRDSDKKGSNRDSPVSKRHTTKDSRDSDKKKKDSDRESVSRRHATKDSRATDKKDSDRESVSRHHAFKDSRATDKTDSDRESVSRRHTTKDSRATDKTDSDRDLSVSKRHNTKVSRATDKADDYNRESVLRRHATKVSRATDKKGSDRDSPVSRYHASKDSHVTDNIDDDSDRDLPVTRHHATIDSCATNKEDGSNRESVSKHHATKVSHATDNAADSDRDSSVSRHQAAKDSCATDKKDKDSDRDSSVSRHHAAKDSCATDKKDKDSDRDSNHSPVSKPLFTKEDSNSNAEGDVKIIDLVPETGVDFWGEGSDSDVDTWTKLKPINNVVAQQEAEQQMVTATDMPRGTVSKQTCDHLSDQSSDNQDEAGGNRIPAEATDSTVRSLAEAKRHDVLAKNTRSEAYLSLSEDSSDDEALDLSAMTTDTRRPAAKAMDADAEKVHSASHQNLVAQQEAEQQKATATETPCGPISKQSRDHVSDQSKDNQDEACGKSAPVEATDNAVRSLAEAKRHDVVAKNTRSEAYLSLSEDSSDDEGPDLRAVPTDTHRTITDAIDADAEKVNSASHQNLTEDFSGQDDHLDDSVEKSLMVKKQNSKKFEDERGNCRVSEDERYEKASEVKSHRSKKTDDESSYVSTSKDEGDKKVCHSKIQPAQECLNQKEKLNKAAINNNVSPPRLSAESCHGQSKDGREPQPSKTKEMETKKMSKEPDNKAEGTQADFSLSDDSSDFSDDDDYDDDGKGKVETWSVVRVKTKDNKDDDIEDNNDRILPKDSQTHLSDQSSDTDDYDSKKPTESNARKNIASCKTKSDHHKQENKSVALNEEDDKSDESVSARPLFRVSGVNKTYSRKRGHSLSSSSPAASKKRSSADPDWSESEASDDTPPSTSAARDTGGSFDLNSSAESGSFWKVAETRVVVDPGRSKPSIVSRITKALTSQAADPSRVGVATAVVNLSRVAVPGWLEKTSGQQRPVTSATVDPAKAKAKAAKLQAKRRSDPWLKSGSKKRRWTKKRSEVVGGGGRGDVGAVEGERVRALKCAEEGDGALPLKCAEEGDSALPLKCAEEGAGALPLKCAEEGDGALPLKCAEEGEGALPLKCAEEGDGALPLKCAEEGEGALPLKCAEEGDSALALKCAEEGEGALPLKCAEEGDGALAFKCHICGRVSSARIRYTRHLDAHAAGKNFCCDACGKMFSSQDRLDTHSVIHQKSINGSFTCRRCGETCRNWRAFLYHESRHSADGGKKYTCDMCGHTFFTTSRLHRHKEHHQRGLNFCCFTCGKLFVSQEILDTHAHKHATQPAPAPRTAAGKAHPARTSKRAAAHVGSHQPLSKRRSWALAPQPAATRKQLKEACQSRGVEEGKYHSSGDRGTALEKAEENSGSGTKALREEEEEGEAIVRGGGMTWEKGGGGLRRCPSRPGGAAWRAPALDGGEVRKSSRKREHSRKRCTCCPGSPSFTLLPHIKGPRSRSPAAAEGGGPKVAKLEKTDECGFVAAMAGSQSKVISASSNISSPSKVSSPSSKVMSPSTVIPPSKVTSKGTWCREGGLQFHVALRACSVKLERSPELAAHSLSPSPERSVVVKSERPLCIKSENPVSYRLARDKPKDSQVSLDNGQPSSPEVSDQEELARQELTPSLNASTPVGERTCDIEHHHSSASENLTTKLVEKTPKSQSENTSKHASEKTKNSQLEKISKSALENAQKSTSVKALKYVSENTQKSESEKTSKSSSEKTLTSASEITPKSATETIPSQKTLKSALEKTRMSASEKLKRSSTHPYEGRKVKIYRTASEKLLPRNLALAGRKTPKDKPVKAPKEGKGRDSDSKTKGLTKMSFPCGICGKSFGSDSAVKIHIGKHLTAGTPARAQVDIESVAQSLAYSRGGQGGDKGGYSCHRCGYVAAAYADLSKHMWMHSQKKFQCSECQAAFIKPETLQLHMKAHSGSKNNAPPRAVKV